MDYWQDAFPPVDRGRLHKAAREVILPARPPIGGVNYGMETEDANAPGLRVAVVSEPGA